MTLIEHLEQAREHTRKAAQLGGDDLDEVTRELLRATDALAQAQRAICAGLRGKKGGGA